MCELDIRGKWLFFNESCLLIYPAALTVKTKSEIAKPSLRPGRSFWGWASPPLLISLTCFVPAEPTRKNHWGNSGDWVYLFNFCPQRIAVTTRSGFYHLRTSARVRHTQVWADGPHSPCLSCKLDHTSDPSPKLLSHSPLQVWWIKAPNLIFFSVSADRSLHHLRAILFICDVKERVPWSLL